MMSPLPLVHADVTMFDPSVVYGAGEALSLLSHLFSCPKWPQTEKGVLLFLLVLSINMYSTVVLLCRICKSGPCVTSTTR